jgi:hypothetical protein
MRSPAVVEVQVMADRTAGLADAVVGLQIHLLIFDAAPQSLDEDIIPPSPFTVHADRNGVVREHTVESRARELRALIRVGDLRLDMPTADLAGLATSANRRRGTPDAAGRDGA